MKNLKKHTNESVKSLFSINGGNYIFIYICYKEKYIKKDWYTKKKGGLGQNLFIRI